MKKILPIAACLLTLVASAVNAQNLSASDNKLIAFVPTSRANIIDVHPASKTKDPNGLVLNRFKIDFPGVTDDVWAKTINGFIVSFTFKGIQTTCFVTGRGVCENTIRYYSEAELPTEIRKGVKMEYLDYSIKSVKEVTHNNKIAYLVTIEDKTSWKVIRMVDGELDVWEDYIKG